MTPWLLMGMAAIVGIVAIGMDGGRMMEERRRVQAAADAAALAGAAQLYSNYWVLLGKDTNGSARDAALKSAAGNGLNNDGTTSIVTVNVPPQSGAFAGKDEFIEVIVQSNLKGSFGTIFTGQDLKVTARAVARGRPAKIGIIALSPSGAGTFLNKGLGTFAVLNCPIIVNSSDPAALNQNGLLLLASSFQITGNYVNSSGGLILGPIDTGVDPTPDPLSGFPAPNPASYTVQSAKPLVINSLLPTILQPGVYRGGIQISGVSIVTMMPGVYVMDGGGLKVSGLATLAGVGVMIYNTSGSFPAGPININSAGKVALLAPLSGTYQGIGIFQDRSMNQPITITGVGLSAIAGTVYAPAAPVSLSGLVAAGLDTLGGAYICSTLQVSGIGGINISLGNNPPRVPDIKLVE